MAELAQAGASAFSDVGSFAASNPQLVQAAGSIGSSLLSSNAANKAAGAQEAGANASTQLYRDIYNQNRADLTPWRTAGQNALAQLQYSLGIGPAPGAAQNPLTQMAQGPGTGFSPQQQAQTPGVAAAMAAGPHSGTGAKQVAGIAGGVAGAATGVPFLGNVASALTPNNAPAWTAVAGGPLVGSLFKKNRPYIQDIYDALSQGRAVTDSDWAKAGYGPGGAALGGTQGAAGALPTVPLDQANPTINPLGTLAAQGPYGAFQQSPGYQFAFDEGQRATQQGMAARGLGNSGAAIKAETRFGQGIANQEWGNWLNRLAAISGVGQTATGQTAQLGANYATNAGQSLQDAAAARASGYVGSSNAITGGINQLSKLWGQNSNSGSGYGGLPTGAMDPNGFPGSRGGYGSGTGIFGGIDPTGIIYL